MNRPEGADERMVRAAREVTERAIRRLDVLEWVILAGAVALALAGGWVVAVLLATAADLPFRVVWIVSALVLFGGPGAVALRRMRRERKQQRERIEDDERHG